MKLSPRLSRSAIALCATAALLAACGGSDGDSDSNSDGDGASKYVDGGTFTMALKGDPGKLDPQSSASSQLFTVNQLAYDNLVAVNGETGEIESQLAKEWAVDGTTVTLTLNDGITCADGSAFTATTVADNIAYVGDPKNKSPFLGAFLPVGATAKADDAAGTVTITLAAPAPFVLNGLASLPMVCDVRHGGPQVAATPRPPAPARTSSPRRCRATTTRTRSATATPGARTARRRRRRACPTPSS